MNRFNFVPSTVLERANIQQNAAIGIPTRRATGNNLPRFLHARGVACGKVRVGSFSEVDLRNREVSLPPRPDTLCPFSNRRFVHKPGSLDTSLAVSLCGIPPAGRSSALGEKPDGSERSNQQGEATLDRMIDGICRGCQILASSPFSVWTIKAQKFPSAV
jgi:hypothetical protein